MEDDSYFHGSLWDNWKCHEVNHTTKKTTLAASYNSSSHLVACCRLVYSLVFDISQHSHGHGIDVLMASVVGCMIYAFVIINIAGRYSVWIVVVLTIERLMLTRYPLVQDPN